MADRRGTGLVVSGTALIACTYGLARYGYGLFLPTFRADFALPSSLAGLLATGAFGSYCAAALLSRRLVGSDRARAAAVLAGALAAGGCAGVAAAPNPAALGVAVLVAGSGAGLASPALVALVDRAVPSAGRPRAQTVVNAGTGLGVLLAGPLALALVGQWRLAWLCFAALTALAAVATARAAAAPGGAGASATATGGPGALAPASLRSLRPAVVAALLAGIGSAAMWTFGRDLVVTVGGAGGPAATAFWTVLGAAGVTGAVAGDAVRRWDVPRAWTAFALALAGATAALPLAPGRPAVAFACAAVFGGSYVALSGVLIAWGTLLDPDSPGSANATLFLTLAAGQATGALLLGGLLDFAGPLPAFAVAAALTVASCLPAAPGTRPSGRVQPASEGREIRA
jgi:predicted MFS family arabinose efflux permease